jgi:hypothetical protein
VNAATLETSVSSSSEVNSPVSFKPTKGKGGTIDELDKIKENLNLEESSGHIDAASDKNLGNINNHTEEDFIAYCGDVFGNSEDAWRSGLRLHDDEQIMHSSSSRQYASNRHQVYVIINDTSKEFDAKITQLLTRKILSAGPTIEQKEKQTPLLQQGKRYTSQQRSGR